jgi:uracil-DNA glycosylase
VIHYRWWELDSVTAVWNAIDRWNASRSESIKNRSICYYGRGPCCSEVMCVGIDFAHNNRWKVPFEKSQSAVLIHGFLKRLKISPLTTYFTNAEKRPGGLTPANLEQLEAEWKICRPKVVIAFGKLPSVMLATKKIPHLTITHPGNFIRRGKAHEWEAFALKQFNDHFEEVTP